MYRIPTYDPPLYNAAKNPATPIANPSPAPAFSFAVAIGTAAAEVGLCSAALPLGVGVGVAPPELDEPELEEPEALGAGVDDAVDAHDAEVGRFTPPCALHKADAVPMIASRLVSNWVTKSERSDEQFCSSVLHVLKTQQERLLINVVFPQMHLKSS